MVLLLIQVQNLTTSLTVDVNILVLLSMLYTWTCVVPSFILALTASMLRVGCGRTASALLALTEIYLDERLTVNNCPFTFLLSQTVATLSLVNPTLLNVIKLELI